MRIYHIPLLIVLCMLNVPNSYAIRRTSLKKITASNTPQLLQSSEKPVIVFDLINVLFKENSLGFAQKVGYRTLTSYALTHWKNPGYRCLDMLDTMSSSTNQKPDVCLTINGRSMPQSIVELQQGKKTCQQTNTEIQQAITHLDAIKFFSSTKEKNLMSSIMNLMLDPQVVPDVTEPIKQTVSLAQKLKKNGHKIYLCANIPEEFYQALQKKHADIVDLFDGVTVSFQTKAVKPEKEIFQQLLSTHALNPAQCIVIDNQKGSIDAAQTLGMRGIIYEKTSQVMSELKKYGIEL